MTYEKLIWILKEMKNHLEAVEDLNSNHRDDIIIEDFSPEQSRAILNEYYNVYKYVERLYYKFNRGDF